MTTTLNRMLYRPVGLVCSVAAHALAGALVSRVWQRTHPGEQHAPPTALNARYGLGVVVLSAMAQGAIVGGVNALVARSGARAFERWTGDWPGS
jgi:hypothetical protein